MLRRQLADYGFWSVSFGSLYPALRRLEKRGLMDVLRNQIIERKVMELVRSEAKFQDEPLEGDRQDVEAIPFAAGGAKDEIPEATEGDEE